MARYTIANLDTRHVFSRFNDLKSAINYYHKIPRRVNGMIVLTDDETGEIIKYKLSKAQLAKIDKGEN